MLLLSANNLCGESQLSVETLAGSKLRQMFPDCSDFLLCLLLPQSLVVRKPEELR